MPPTTEVGAARRALILGGNGFIGSHLVDCLIAHGWQIKILDQAMERFRAPLPGVQYLLGSFEAPDLLGEALKDVDIVFHLVCTTLPKSSNDNPARDVESNLVGTIRLLQACVARSIRKVVFLSSGGTVYGIPAALPIPETHATDPLCSYGIHKLAIEKYLALFHKLHGLDFVILRPSNAYGARQDPRGTQGAIAVFLGRALAGERIEIWGDGEVVRDYVHVSDLVEGIYHAAARSTSSKVFNLGMGVGHTLNDLCRAIGRMLGRQLHVSHFPGRLFDIPTIVLDVSRARRELGWEPKVHLEAGIRDAWAFVRWAVSR